MFSPAATAGGTPGIRVSSRDWLLQPVILGQVDDQDLFELSLKLKCTMDPRVALPALLQLHSCFLVDMPVEAVVAKHGIVVGGWIE